MFPPTATFDASRPKLFATISFSIGVLLPPPTRKTALGAQSFISVIDVAITSARFATTSEIVSLSSLGLRESSFPNISTALISSRFSESLYFISSAVEKSTRSEFTIASLISSPATVAIVYAVTVPSLDTAISEVPAPMSTSAKFNILSSRGITAFIAAIGSSVRVSIEEPIFSTTAFRLSTTSLGKNVTIISTRKFPPLCPTSVAIL